jgi:16S rRNA (uracil1498-N3)-methyltransferase
MIRPPVAPPLVFVEDLDAPVLDPGDDHHLRRVLRVPDGATLTVADGHGAWRRASYGREITPESTVFDEPSRSPELTVAFAVVKGDRPELVVQKLTELGIDRIVPFVASRSVVRWDVDRAARNVERMRRVARESAMQCRRARLPVVEELTDFGDVVARPGAALADFGGDPPTLVHPTIVIGPEGGWSDDERARAAARVSLATHVLRAETAAITAASLLSGLRASLVREGAAHDPSTTTG